MIAQEVTDAPHRRASNDFQACEKNVSLDPEARTRALHVCKIDPRFIVYTTNKATLAAGFLVSMFGGVSRRFWGGRKRLHGLMKRCFGYEKSAANDAIRDLKREGWILDEGKVWVWDDSRYGLDETRDRSWLMDEHYEDPKVYVDALWILEVFRTLTALEIRMLGVMLFQKDEERKLFSGVRFFKDELKAHEGSIRRAMRVLMRKRLIRRAWSEADQKKYTWVAQVEKVDAVAFEDSFAAMRRKKEGLKAAKMDVVGMSKESRERLKTYKSTSTVAGSTGDCSTTDRKLLSERPEIVHKNQDKGTEEFKPSVSSSRAHAGAHAHAKSPERVKEEDKRTKVRTTQGKLQRNKTRKERKVWGVEERIVLAVLCQIWGGDLSPWEEESALELISARLKERRINATELVSRGKLYRAFAEIQLTLLGWLRGPYKNWRYFSSQETVKQTRRHMRCVLEEYRDRLMNPIECPELEGPRETEEVPDLPFVDENCYPLPLWVESGTGPQTECRWEQLTGSNGRWWWVYVVCEDTWCEMDRESQERVWPLLRPEAREKLENRYYAGR